MPEALLLVTVITPAYNRASYLNETIESVVSQDYPQIEYIVLDDGSTDNTREVLEKYNGRIIWETHPNMGESRTVNKGFSMAHGDIVAVVNSDDPLMPGAVSQAVDFMQSRPDILVAYPDFNKIGPHSELLYHVRVEDYDYVRFVRRFDSYIGPGAFIRRKCLELTHGRDPRFRFAADWEYWLRLGLHGQFARIPKTLATHRWHPDSMIVSGRGPMLANEYIALVKEYYSRSDLPPEIRKVRREAFANAYLRATELCGRDLRRSVEWSIVAISYYPPIATEVARRFAVRSLWRVVSMLPAPVRTAVRKRCGRARAILVGVKGHGA
jgi:glycosyltransferase involved in cell wall biosynthesis